MKWFINNFWKAFTALWGICMQLYIWLYVQMAVLDYFGTYYYWALYLLLGPSSGRYNFLKLSSECNAIVFYKSNWWTLLNYMDAICFHASFLVLACMVLAFICGLSSLLMHNQRGPLLLPTAYRRRSHGRVTAYCPVHLSCHVTLLQKLSMSWFVNLWSTDPIWLVWMVLAGLRSSRAVQ